MIFLLCYFSIGLIWMFVIDRIALKVTKQTVYEYLIKESGRKSSALVLAFFWPVFVGYAIVFTIGWIFEAVAGKIR